LAGLGRTLEASKFAADNGINLDADYLLNEETGRDLDRQRKLNKSLMVLTGVVSLVALAAIIIMRMREKLLRQLKIKTKEATDMARLDAGQLELAPHEADLSTALSNMPLNWTEMAEEKGLTFTHFVDPKIGTHHIDEERLVQCLNIVLENAIRFTDAGRVHMHITAEVNNSEQVTGMTAIIADTGQGMSAHVQSRLFTPFMQADTSRKRTHMGTGLSLAIAYALVAKMGGTLNVISREGRGSEFKFGACLRPCSRSCPRVYTRACPRACHWATAHSYYR